jgi:Flp pilus assembly CpaE family ATPase
MDAADKVLLVVQPELPGITHASRFLDLTNELGYDRSKVMLVVSGVVEKQGISPADVSRALKRPSPLVIPDDSMWTRQAINRGEPLVVGKAAGRPVGKAFSQIASKLVKEFNTPDGQAAEEPKKGFFARLFGGG